MIVLTCIPRVQKFLCCVELRCGVLIIIIMKSILNIVTLVISVEFLADIRRYTDHTIVLMNGMMMFAQGVLGFTAAVFLLNAVWKYESAQVFVYLWVQLINLLLMVVCVVTAFVMETWIGVYCFSNFAFTLYSWIVVKSYYEMMRSYLNFTPTVQ